MRNIKMALNNLLNKIPGENAGIGHITFLYSAMVGTLLSVLGIIGNLSMSFNILALIIPLLNAIVDILSIIYSVKTKRWEGAATFMLAFAGFVLFPFLWFTTGGTMSSSLPLVVSLGFVMMITIPERTRVFVFLGTLFLFSGFIVAELYNPNIFIPYPTRQSQYIDILIGFSTSFIAVGCLASLTISRYNKARLQTEKLLNQMEVISITDPLTGVFNRRYFMSCIDDEMRKAYDSGLPLTLCIIDIDRFKDINDSYGHLYGDEVLVVLSKIIKNCLDESGIFGRYGGEEFVIIFKNKTLEESLVTINNFMDSIRKANWKHGKPITVSCGVSVYTKGIPYSKFMEKADNNLYKAKNTGRDRVEYEM